MATQGRNGSIPLIAGLLIIGPTALLLIWTLRDRDAQNARELGMWVRVVQRAGEFGSGGRIRRELPDVPIAAEIDRINLRDTADEYSETLTPMIANPGVLSLRVNGLPLLVRGRLARDHAARGSHARSIFSPPYSL